MPELINKKTVEEIAALARLGLTAEELAAQVNALNDVLSHFSSIQAIDTKNVPTADDVTTLKNVMRPDAAQPDIYCLPEKLLENAPAVLKGQIKVPAVF